MAVSEYYAQYLLTADSDMRLRIAAAAQTESTALAGVPIKDPDAWANDHRWEWATTPGWAAKVQSAIDGGVPDWGRDPAVITDGDILSTIQPMMVPGP